MRAFLTGGDGFAGRWLRRALTEAGHEAQSPAVAVTDSGAVHLAMAKAQPQWVFHLAAVGDPGLPRPTQGVP